MNKIYAIKLNNGNLHKNNLGEIVYFSNKYNARDYMKYNHYDGVIQPLHIDKDNKIADLEAKLAITQKALELACERLKDFEEMQDNEMGFTEMFGYTSQYDLQEIIDSYIKQAKEMGKNE